MRNLFVISSMMFFLGAFIEAIGNENDLSKQQYLVAVFILDKTTFGASSTLSSCAQEGLDSFLLIDNGASRTCINEAKQILDCYQKNYSIVPHTLYVQETDVSALVKKHYEHAKWFLILESGWRLHDGHTLKNFLETVDTEITSCGMLLVNSNESVEQYVPCITRVEQSDSKQHATYENYCVISGTHFSYDGMHYGIVYFKDHLEQLKNSLITAYEQKSGRSIDLMRIAQIYGDLNQWQEAFQWYQRAADETKIPQEKSYALYKCGQIIRQLAKDSGKGLQEALPFYKEAARSCSNRAEPFIALGQYYMNNSEDKFAYFYLKQAAMCPFPTNPYMPFERELYEHTRFDLLGLVSWYVGEFEIGEWAVRMLLESRPHDGHQKGNLQFYLDRKAQLQKFTPKETLVQFCPDFHDSMEKHARLMGTAYNRTDMEQDDFFRVVIGNYNKYIINEPDYSEQPRIPKIIHQIWLGNPFPEKFRALQETWINNHPDWQYCFWTEKEVEEFGLENQKAFDAATNVGEKADIVRYEILYRIGGVYVDVDFECLQPLDPLHHLCDFYSCFEAWLPGGFEVWGFDVGIGIIGTVPGHPILKACVENLRASTESINHGYGTLDRTGPFYFTRILKNNLKQCTDKTVLLPLGYFYPWRQWHWSAKNIRSSIRPESFGIHHYFSSWLS